MRSADSKILMAAATLLSGRVPVRERVDGKWGAHFLQDLPAEAAIRHTVRLMLRAADLEDNIPENLRDMLEGRS